jgi:hypothetical protein
MPSAVACDLAPVRFFGAFLVGSYHKYAILASCLVADQAVAGDEGLESSSCCPLGGQLLTSAIRAGPGIVSGALVERGVICPRGKRDDHAALQVPAATRIMLLLD